MESIKRQKKDRRRRAAYNITNAQYIIWSKALDVSNQISCKISNRKNVFSEKFLDYLQSMKGEIRSVQKQQYKINKHNSIKIIIAKLEQYFNRIFNVYLDQKYSNNEILSLVRLEVTEMHRYCYRMKNSHFT
jgi:hypothetical protein